MIDQLKKIVVLTGKRLLDLRKSTNIEGSWIGSQFKSDSDLIAHNQILSMLKLNFPGIKIISEEDSKADIVPSSDYFLVDPIDGTASYANGFSGFVVQIYYLEKNKPVLCVIYAPVFDQLYWSEKNKGSFVNLKRLIVQNNFPLQFHTIIDNYSTPRGICQSLVKQLNIPNYYECGSISLKICKIAEESADLFVKDIQPRDWDLAAPDLVLQEAGGFLSNIRGKPIVYGKIGRKHNGLIATTSKDKLIKISESVRKVIAFS